MVERNWDLYMLLFLITLVGVSIMIISSITLGTSLQIRTLLDQDKEVPIGVCGDRFQSLPCVDISKPIEYYTNQYTTPGNHTCKYNDACYHENCVDVPNSSWMSCDRCMIECTSDDLQLGK